jgi:thiol-disulfide isomerase/thioredoxin
MKKAVFSVLLAFIVSFVSAQTAESTEGINFEKGTWSEVLAKAKKENKYVFVDAFTTWCGPCKWMEKNVFPQAEVGTFFNKNFVNAKIDMEKGEGIDLAKKYNVNVYPTYLYVNGDGELVHRLVGSMESPAFISGSTNALNPETQYVTLTKRFDNGEKDPEFVYKLAYAARGAYDMGKAQELAASYLKSQTNWLDEKNVKFIGEFTSTATDPNFEFMKKNASVFEASMGKERYHAQMYNMVYQGSFQQVGFKRDAAKEQVAKCIVDADAYFKKTLPEQAPKLSNSFAMSVYRSTKDWDSYAKQAISYYDKNPSSDWTELNSVAWNFFENVANTAQLQKAVAWALQSVKLNENYANTDTVANLYYKLGDKSNAKDYANKAITLGKANGEDTSGTEKLLQDIVQL